MANAQLPYGGYYISSTSATTNPTTPTKAAGTTTAFALNGFSHTNNRLTYTGTATRHFAISAYVSTTASAADTVDIYIYTGGDTEVTGSHIQRKVPINDVGAAALGCIVQLATDEYIEVFFHVTGTANVTWEAGSVVVTIAG